MTQEASAPRDAGVGTPRGMVFDIQGFSIHDGPGIRTTVFLKGCPLGCLWCHNPESLSPEPQMSWAPRRCINCGACIPVCPVGAQRNEAGAHVFYRDKCVSCGRCADVCPTLAMEISGREMTVDQVMKRVLGDKPFYGQSGGGMTVSGGEPLLQADFTDALLCAGRAHGIHVAVETSGAGRPADVERMAAHSDLVMFDIKASPEDYFRLTRLEYEIAVDSLRRVAKAGCEVWLRLPMVPGVNDTEAHFANIASVAAEIKPARVDLLPYHVLGEEKRERFGLPPSAMPDVKSPERETVLMWQARLRELGVDARLSGSDA